MKDIWDYFKNLFQKAEESSLSTPYIHEMLSRPDGYQHGFDAWKDSKSSAGLLEWIDWQYGLWQALPEDIDESIDFLNMPSSKGFVIYVNKRKMEKQETTYLFDLLKEKVLGLNYKSVMSDTRTWAREAWVETLERHYLKPRTVWDDSKVNQRYGNITIEFSLRNDAPHHLKFRVDSYKGQKYRPAESFKDLMQAIMS